MLKPGPRASMLMAAWLRSRLPDVRLSGRLKRTWTCRQQQDQVHMQAVASSSRQYKAEAHVFLQAVAG